MSWNAQTFEAGSRLGRFTVLGRDEQRKRPSWRVRCDCGTVRVFRSHEMQVHAELPCLCTRDRREAVAAARRGEVPPAPMKTPVVPGAAWIPLTRGKFALVDEASVELVAQHTWHAVPSAAGVWYARTHIRNDGGRETTVSMHRLLMNEPAAHVDHINRDGLDNRLLNLRLAARDQNQHNRTKSPQGSSRFKGVSLERSSGKWRAKLKLNRKSVDLGRHDSEEIAARAYDSAAREAFGEFARTNFPG